MQRNLLLSVLIWLLEIILVASFVSDRWTRELQAVEDKMLIAYVGAEKEAEIRQVSQQWFGRLFVQTGIRENVYRYFIPTEHERQMSKGFENVGRYDLFPFIQSRLDVLWDTLYQMLKRLVTAMIWGSYSAVTLLPFAMDGWVQRKVSQTNFDYPSPLVHRYSLFVIFGEVYLLLMSLTLPFPLPPQIVPIGALIMALAVNLLVANTQKRV